MQTKTIDSTSVAEVGYEQEENLLRVQFQNGSTYDYFDVPADVYEGILRAPSAGRFFNENVSGEFAYQRV